MLCCEVCLWGCMPGHGANPPLLWVTGEVWSRRCVCLQRKQWCSCSLHLWGRGTGVGARPLAGACSEDSDLVHA